MTKEEFLALVKIKEAPRRSRFYVEFRAYLDVEIGATIAIEEISKPKVLDQVKADLKEMFYRKVFKNSNRDKCLDAIEQLLMEKEMTFSLAEKLMKLRSLI